MRRRAQQPPAPLDFDPAAPDAFMWVMAAMAYPRSRRRQEQAVSTWHLDAAGHARDVAPKVAQMGREAAEAAFWRDLGLSPEAGAFAPWTAEHVARMAAPEDAYRHAMAGWQRVPAPEKTAADAPGTLAILRDVQATVDGGAHHAGFLLMTVATLNKLHPEVDASLSRAMAVCAAAARAEGRKPRDTRTLKRAWKDWRSSAPLVAAHMMVAMFLHDHMPGDVGVELPAQEALLHPQGPGFIVRMAAWFRDFGLNFTPRNAKEPLLSAAECPAMPAGTEPLEPRFAPLPEDILSEVRGPAQGGRYIWNPLDRGDW